MGEGRDEGETEPASIQKRIDALLIAHQYAIETEKTIIQQRIKALQTSLDYAEIKG